MDIEEAAKQLGVSTKTIRRLVASGQLQARRVKGERGQKLVFSLQDLEAYRQREQVHPSVEENLDK